MKDKFLDQNKISNRAKIDGSPKYVKEEDGEVQKGNKKVKCVSVHLYLVFHNLYNNNSCVIFGEFKNW